jgi:tetratricopeptide (TPR) repeat protein
LLDFAEPARSNIGMNISRKVSNNSAIILPKDVLAQLRVALGYVLQKTVALFVVTILFVASALSAQDAKDIAKERLASVEAAAQFLQSGNQKSAIESAEQAISSFEAEYPAGGKRVNCAEGPTQTLMVLSVAAGFKQDAIALDMTWCDALFIKGFALIDLGRNDEAFTFRKRASDMAPLSAHYKNEFAEWYKTNRQWQQSYDQFAAARDLSEFATDDYKKEFEARSLRGMGFALIELGKLDEAEKMFKLSLKLQPDHAGAKNELDYIEEQRAKH